MKIEYDSVADALYVSFKEDYAEQNVDIEEGVTVDLDKNGHLLGIEVLDASKRFNIKDLTKISIENFPVIESYEKAS